MRLAAAGCLVAAGLLVGGTGGALAFADPPVEPGDGPTDTDTSQSREAGNPSGTQGPADRTVGGGKLGGPRSPTDQTGKPEDGRKETGERDGDQEKPDDGREVKEPDDEGGSTTTPTPDPTKTEQPEEPEEPGPCEDKGGDDDCEPGLPGPPAQASAGGGGGSDAVEVPSGRPDLPPTMLLPAHLLDGPGQPADPIEQISALPGTGAAGLPTAPISLPPLTAPLTAPLTGPGAGGDGPAPAAAPGAPSAVTGEPPVAPQAPPTDPLGTAAGLSSSYRVGYPDALRSAGLAQVIVLAAPGLAGMLVLTGAGGLVGFRQAKAGQVIRSGAAARFVN